MSDKYMDSYVAEYNPLPPQDLLYLKPLITLAANIMSDKPQDFGDTLSSGIQDVAALLPLLGTDQCERQAGSSLEKGYMYSAASILSLFGSLGIAKAGFATFLGSIAHPPFYGGRWLDNAGFITPGSVTSMVTIDKATGLYGAEANLRKLLKEQYIDDPRLISGFTWSGWGRLRKERDRPGWKEDDDHLSKHPLAMARFLITPDFNELVCNVKGIGRRFYRSWNAMLIVTSAVSGIISVFPYVYLSSSRWGTPLPWIYSLRIHRITSMSLEWLKVRKRNGEELEEQKRNGLLPLEQRVRQYFVDRSSALSRAEEGHRSTPDDNVLRDLLRVDWWLIGYQLLIAMGMGMIVAGYVGCFSIVGKTSAPAGPSVWFALEASLSLLRIALWGWNVSWDKGTRLIMKLELHTSRDPYYPLITSPHTSEELGFEAKSCSPKPFTVYSEAEFFATASSWIGPIQRLGANAVTLYYALLAHTGVACKDLSITILLTDSRPFTFLCHGHDTQSVIVFSSKLEIVPANAGLVCYQVTLGDRVERENDGFLRSQLFYDVLRHAQTLRVRLFADGQDRMDLRWDVHQDFRRTCLWNNQDETRVCLDSASLSAHDKEYIGLRELWDSAVSDCIQNRYHKGDDATGARRNNDFFRSEALVLFETSICEMYIWTREREFIDSRRMHEKLSLQLHPECYRAMEARFTIRMQGALSRYQKYGWDDSAASQSKSGAGQLKEAWAYLHDTLRKLRSPVPNSLQQTVQSHFQKIICQGLERENLATELSHLFLPPPLDVWLDYQISRSGCVSSLCFALETIRNTQPHYFDSRPYHMVEQTRSTLNLPRLRRNKDLCVLEIKLDKERQNTAGDFLNSIVYPEQTRGHGQGVQMTTLILSDCHKISSNIKVALAEHITSYPNILCLAGTRCPIPVDDCKEPHCSAVLANREAWKVNATKGTTFVYRVGFEGQWDAELQARGDHIGLDKLGRCLILFYCPDQGKITVTLSARNRHDESIVLKSTLMSDMGGTQTITDDQVLPREADQGAPKDTVWEFWNVRKGIGEVGIQEASNKAWEVHGIIEVQWMDRNDAGSMNRAQAGECSYLVAARSRSRRLVTASVATR
ncbi:hypothetical protein VNI00_012587 [Paramarasmius palmivorus]|uniref:Uncharacterized protein n=1 Tax=Paramarasmius palmivorus TaxID=297713 RepID=A0AAW0C5V5_9AGAR